MKTAIILGANGQDGRLMTEELLLRGYQVTGVGRQPRSRSVPHGRFRYVPLDLSDHLALEGLMDELTPDIAFHLAAVHGAAGFAYEPLYASLLGVNVIALQVLLEHARRRPGMPVIYASSSKVFGLDLPALITEETPFKASCLYSISKNTAHSLIEYYRKNHRISACTFYLFNHESPYRPAHYFIPKLVRALAAARRGSAESYRFHSLDFFGNWGCAKEYMKIIIDVIEKPLNEDYIIASDFTWCGRDLCEALFLRHNLSFQDYVGKAAIGAPPKAAWRPSTRKLKEHLGYSPERSILEVCDEILHSVELNDLGEGIEYEC